MQVHDPLTIAEELDQLRIAIDHGVFRCREVNGGLQDIGILFTYQPDAAGIAFDKPGQHSDNSFGKWRIVAEVGQLPGHF